MGGGIYILTMKNSIKERAKKVPLKIKIRVTLMIWWLKLKHFFKNK
jgi:hypothetical protein